LILLIGAFLHPLVERAFTPWDLSVDAPFLLMFWIALRRGPLAGTAYGFLLGLLRDLGNFAQLGATSLALSLGGFAVGRLRDKIDRDNLPIRLLLLILAYLFVQAVFLLPRSGWSPAAAAPAWFRYALPGSLLNALAYTASLLVVWIFREGVALLHEPAGRR